MNASASIAYEGGADRLSGSLSDHRRLTDRAPRVVAPIRHDTVERAVAEVRAGRPVVVIDDHDRDADGHLVFAAELATPDRVAFMVRHTSGYIRVAIAEADADRLDLPPMFHTSQSVRGIGYAVTVDARHGVTTGISAHDRAHTIRLLADPGAGAADLARPGHVVPLRAQDGGVLRRRGLAEAAVDLAVLAGLRPAGVLCEVVSQQEPATMARADELRLFADEHDLALVCISDLIAHRRRSEKLVRRVAAARLPLRYGEFTAIGYASSYDRREHVAFVCGELGDGEDVLVRVHTECLAGDVFGSLLCDCAPQLRAALAAVAQAGRGVVLYIRGHEGQGLPLAPAGRTGTAEAHDDSTGAHALVDLGVRSVRLLTNNPRRWAGLEWYGLRVTGTRPLPVQTVQGSRTDVVEAYDGRAMSA
ncbi:3,4-dihydroxy-2-butanone-4-phosphate synthase [Dactylosporangium sp. CA-092794]|uniref:3,4-dihydroxy-2-butanone-4-phosphate synthase n=1 Tax=Dactylosporangium sp. CA-092794 TaxID=3239929 RepID=UPI003D8FA6F5